MLRKIFRILMYFIITVLVIGIIMGIMYYPSVKVLFMEGKKVSYDSSLSFYLGGGGNSTVFESDSAVVVIDTKYGKAAKRLYDDVKALAAGRQIIVINTHSDLDHVGGNPLYKNARIISGKVKESYWIANNSKEGMPAEWISDSLEIKLDSEVIQIIDMGRAHTWNDVVVLFKNRKVLVSGDLVFNKINAFLSKDKGSDGWKSIQALRRMKGINGVKTLVPGHGEIGGTELIDNMLQYFEDMDKAADNPALEQEVKKKYSQWVKMPGAASPQIIINYFRAEN